MRRESSLPFVFAMGLLFLTVVAGGCARSTISEGSLVYCSDPQAARPPDPRLLHRLEKPINVNFDATRLITALDHVHHAVDVNVLVNWDALEAVGVERDTPVTFQLDSVPAVQILDFILKRAGAASDLEPLDFRIAGNVVYISTQRDLGKVMEIRVYDVRDLLPQTNRPPTPTLASREDDSFFAEGVVQLIAGLIEDPIIREGGCIYNGSHMWVYGTDGILTIATFHDQHLQVQALLHELRAAKAARR